MNIKDIEYELVLSEKFMFDHYGANDAWLVSWPGIDGYGVVSCIEIDDLVATITSLFHDADIGDAIAVHGCTVNLAHKHSMNVPQLVVFTKRSDERVTVLRHWKIIRHQANR